ncbi:hypothetical protein E3Q22_00131 [Wallemia mellicola]|uniref:Secreted protein n=2 Tax=Wallemia mellicola TaxID=1708541 RepID=I4YJL9_WALMC|nr:hypothetical protein WALSEDRAFT_59123 [Wallemia mellicola CBS 633.66]TIB82770.1 hypothetical protein E3Q22_00131 [Wallemia mellicola]EIM24161.1 hypothetical protein WALSEDRAFT_59123 [Wallemia mellicola CBS 633.66]TIB94763.1 hypothetical protein E3Q19_00137 [Wallemia mellicola]TIC08140.1 hypothetical protein E3Q16_00100 [Wallemia mellicola]TIC47282.1 hypothetical protein E3Q08_00101 [Wallemia mellicola]|eukprot:XP_006955983.1 hypothetical protein WALSEDRAFT_59123 [Wallemia mellicola CBS 633.66]
MLKKVLLVSAALTGTVVNATTYATFYSDPECKNDASVDFSVNNPGCFSAGGNEYVKYHGTNAQCFSLVKSPSPSCPCQFDCITGPNSVGSTISGCGPPIIPDSGCHHIGQAESLRFIGGTCGLSNCPDRSSRSIPVLEEYQDTEEIVEEKGSKENQEEKGEELVKQKSERESQESAKEAETELVSKYNNGVTPALDRRDYGKPGLGYYRFCKDEYCTLDCSINFRTTNTGCIAGDGFKSIQFLGSVSSDTNLRLVHTPHGECSCQDDCWHISGNECMVLPEAQQGAGSYRMITESTCDVNNC